MSAGKSRRFCYFIGALLSCSSALAIEDVMLDDKVRLTQSAQIAIWPESVEIKPKSEFAQYSDSLVVQLRRNEFILSQDLVEHLSTRVYRYLTPDGANDHGNIRATFNAANETVQIELAMVVDSQGNVHVVEPSTIQVLASDTANIFSDSKTIVIPLVGIDVGSTAIIRTRIATDRKAALAPWGASIYAQYSVPQQTSEVRVQWDAPELKPDWRSNYENATCVEVENQSIECVATDVPAYQQDPDVRYADVLPQFVFADRRSWDDIQAWYKPLFASSLSADQSIADMATKLSDGLDSETDVLKAIHKFVAQDVRYVGLEHGSSAYVPHSTSQTLQRRYGDCKDKAALMVDLLDQVGIKMSPVLVSSNRRDIEKLGVPSSSYFDHLIVCGSLSNGKEYCLDGTDSHSGIGALSNWIQGAAALSVDGQAGPFALPADPLRWRIDEELTLTITADGQLLENSKVEYSGAYGSSIRRTLVSLNAQEKQKWALEDYQATVSNRVEPDFQFGGVDQLSDRLSINWDADYGELVDSTIDLDYSEDAPWLDQILSSLKTKNDAYSYRFPGVRYHSKVTIDVDKIWRVALTGPDIDIDIDYGDFSRKYRVNGQKVVVTTKLEAKSRVVSVDEIQRFNRFLEIVQEENTMTVEASLRAK